MSKKPAAEPVTKTDLLARAGLALAAAALLAMQPAPTRAAEPGGPPCDVEVFISGGLNASYQKIAPPFEQARGKTLCTANGASMGDTPTAIPNRLARGEPADVVILSRGALDDLVDKGLVVRGSQVDIVRSKIGMAVRAGAPKPDISTSEAFRQTLLRAGSVAYSDSASGVYIQGEMLKAMGVEAQVKPKSRQIPGTPVGVEVAEGRAEIGFQQISELTPIPGIVVVGPIPEPWQRVTVFSAGVTTNARHPAEARALIARLASPEAWPVLREDGLEPAAAAGSPR